MSDQNNGSARKRNVVVIGNGMVGQRFCEKLVEFDIAKRYRIVTFCEEPRAAYDRVGLTTFFAHRDAEKMMMARMDWYEENDVELHIGDRACEIDRDAFIVRSEKGVEIEYDAVILATGSYPFVPPIPGIDKQGVFVYRTLEDLERITKYSETAKRAAVIGGGLLGLEAAKAVYDLGWKHMSSSSHHDSCRGKLTMLVREFWLRKLSRSVSMCISIKERKRSTAAHVWNGWNSTMANRSMSI